MGELGRFKTYWRDASPARAALAAAHTPESIASELRNARLLQGYRLSEVASALNIREGHLEALEEGRFRDLPPLVYAKGFVAAYAGFLQLNRAELLTRFEAEATNDNRALAELPTLPALPFKAAVDMEVRRRPGLVALLAGFIMLLSIYSVWQPGSSTERARALEVPPLPSRFAEAPAPVASEGHSGTVYAQPAAPVVVAPPTVRVRAYGEGWMQLHDLNGVRVASLVLKPGQIYEIPKGRVLKLSTGNLAMLAILVDDRVAPLATPVGRSRTEVLLDPARLLDGSAVLN